MASSTQGKKLSYGVQSVFGTAVATTKDVKLEGDPTFETPVGTGVQPETMGANPFYNNKPIVKDQASDSAVTCTTLIRSAAVNGEDSFLKTAFEAGGYEVDSIASDTTVKAGFAVGSIPVTSATGMEPGLGVSIGLDSGQFVPTLIGSMSSDTIIPAMELPSNTELGNQVMKSFTITPGVMDEIAANKLLTLVGGTNVGTVQAQDCALTSIGDLTFNANEKISLELTFGASDKSRADVATTHGNTFADGDNALVTYQPWCQFSDTQTTWTSALSASYIKLISATITLNITAEQIVGMGDANCKNNIQGWIQKGELVNISLDMLYDSDKLDDFDGDNDNKYISIIQPGTFEEDPSVGFFAPNCHQVEAPVCDYIGNNEHRVQVQYTTNPAAISGTTDADLGNQPWYLVIQDKSA